MKMQEWDDAIKDFSKVIKMDSKYTEAWLNRGISHYYNHEYSEAIDDWTKAKEHAAKFSSNTE